MIKKFHTKVVGVTFNNIQDYLPNIRINDSLQAVFEPDNVYDKNAVAIYHKQNKIGYFSRKISQTLKPDYDIQIVVTAITGSVNQHYGCNILVIVDDHIEKDDGNIINEIFNI